MAEKKGDKVASFTHTFRRDSNDRASQTIRYPESESVEPATEYLLHGTAPNAGFDFEPIVNKVIETHSAPNRSFSLPRDCINSRGIRAGDTIQITLYEFEYTDAFNSESTSVILDRIEVASDKTCSDNCHSNLTSREVCEYLGADTKQLKFRNIKTQSEATGTISQTKTNNHAFSFPHDVRKQIDARPGNIIEIVAPTGNSDNSETVLDVDIETDKAEKIDEMYRMVSELYDAYTAAKND